MKQSLFIVPLALIFLFFTGCVHVEELVQKVKGQPAAAELKETPEKKVPFEGRPFWQKALAYETEGELQRALMFANIAGELSPDNNEISEKTAELRAEIEQKGDQYFNEGVTLYKKQKIGAAREQFILALQTNPNHTDALDYLKNRLPDKEYKEYRVRKHDTLKDIAEKFYNDPEKDFLIVHLNDLDANGALTPGTRLKLVTLDPELSKPSFDSDKALTDAKTLLEKKAYNDVLRAAEEMLEHDPANQEAQDLKSAAYYQMGIALSRQGKYLEAIQTLQKADPQYEGVAEAIQKTTAGELKKAKQLLQAKQYNQAVDITKNILSHDSSNQAAKDLSNAAYCQMGKDFVAKKKYIQALDVLGRADSDHECIKQALSDAKQASKEQAEVHYLKGVKHFLNEELTDAIKEWKLTLALDPDYKKAEKSIQKAQEVLEKLKQVE
jgi:tetratricopeptide (TPR) repeat protein